MVRHLFLLCLLLASSQLFGASTGAAASQREYEQSSRAVVRHKYFYKSGRLEWTALAGIYPYESLVDAYNAGLRLSWHPSDHFGWEVIDFQKAFSTVSKYTTDLVSNKNLARLDMFKPNMTVSSSFLFSPIYGKIRFIGRQVLYFDVYAAVGVGAMNGDAYRFASTGTGQPPTSTNTASWNPMVNVGFGLKIFMNNAMGLTIDFRDYISQVPMYDTRKIKHTFTALAGLTVYTPFF